MLLLLRFYSFIQNDGVYDFPDPDIRWVRGRLTEAYQEILPAKGVRLTGWRGANGFRDRDEVVFSDPILLLLLLRFLVVIQRSMVVLFRKESQRKNGEP